mmetsp:Transcript_3934/g.8196  ORF Transcript_3934/g.8196 Transcript_3934/m.8196 type:complete len:827 (-) Transcript_3934:114-2594(-)|eukprot:CAMPEP_0182532244 /NCGR_PEP_ID=MMETSP1323-20130603/11028_1 /TAXON_ID=236787 /ORGANISM="Florenciella parvula, Strain RCC1693" /LENGTH=826 /DNA_ID=CAMNT_0024741951 /DNA_START=116 /DNA_END=2596 /DNA_ORIENTATION=+
MAQARKLEDGLLHIEQIAVPSVIFFEQCHNRYLSEQMSFIEVMSIWNAVGHAIFDQYLRGKGTKIDYFGTFSLDISNTPIFLPDQAIMKRFRLRPHKSPVKGNCLNQGVPYMAVAKHSRVPTNRSLTSRVLGAVLEHIAYCLSHEITSIVISISGVGEAVIERNGHFGVRFDKDFVAQLRDSRGSKGKTLSTLQAKRQQEKKKLQARHELAHPSFDTGRPTSRGSLRGDVDKPGLADPRGMAANAMGDGEAALMFVKRKLTKRHGMHALRSMRRILRVLDESGDGELDRSELTLGFRNLGLDLKHQVVEALFKLLDEDNGGSLSMDEFYLGLRRSMSVMREKVVTKAFDHVKSLCSLEEGEIKDGEVSVEKIRELHNCDWQPDVKAGKVRFDDMREVFVSMLDSTLLGPRNGFISRAKWVDYYQDVSACQEDDDFFDYMVRSSWNFWDQHGFEHFDEAAAAEPQEGFDREIIHGDEDDQSSLGSRSRRDADLARQGKPPRREPPPWECNEAWTHETMRSRNDWAAPPRPQQEDDGVRRLPVNVYGNLDKVLDMYEDEWGILRKALYKPRCSFDRLCKVLGISGASDFPRIPATSLATRLRQLDPSLRAKQCKECAMVSGKAVVEVSWLHEELVRRYGPNERERPSQMLDRVRKAVIEQCGSLGLRVLRDKLTEFDIDGNDSLTSYELKAGLNGFGIELNNREVEEVFHFFDTDRSNSISFSEFANAVRGELNEDRFAIVQDAWLNISHGSDSIPVQELVRCFDCSWYPSVQDGSVNEDAVLAAFQYNMGADNVNEEAFIGYHTDLSAGIQGDRLFETVVRNTWHLG